MTVSTTTSRIDYTGNGVTTSFSVPFPFIEAAYLRVIRTVVATGVETTLTLNTDYTVDVSDDGQTGSVDTTDAPTSAQRLSIIRDVPATQEADFVANDPLPAETIEDALDKLTMLANDSASAVDRVPRLYDSDIDGSGRYNSNGNRYANAADGVNPTDLATVQQVVAAGSGNFIQAGDGAVTRTMQDKARDTVCVRDFGATGDGVTDDRAAIQAAMDYAAGVATLLIPAGVYRISGALSYKSGAKIVGDGIDASILRFTDSAHEDSNMLQPAAFDMSVGNCYFSDFTLDGNRAARVASGAVTGVGTQRPGSSGVATMSSYRCLFERIKSIGQVLHGFDDCPGGDLNGDGDRRYVYPTGPTTYSATPSRDNTFSDCIAEDWGDDGFTSHYCENVKFIRPVARNASDWYAANINGTNGIEFDDGTLGGICDGAYVYRAAGGIVAKGHNDEPAASSISIVNSTIEECGAGINVYGETGAGVARDCIVSGNKVRKPYYIAGRTLDQNGIRVSNYDTCVVTNNVLDSAGASVTNGSGILISLVAKNVTISGNVVKGWPGDGNTSDNNLAGIRITPDSTVTIGMNRVINCGYRGLRWTGSIVGGRDIGPLYVEGTSMALSVGIDMSVYPTAGNVLATVTGYPTPTSYGAQAWTDKAASLNSGHLIVGGHLGAGDDIARTYHNLRHAIADAAGDTVCTITQQGGQVSASFHARGPGGSAGYSSANACAKFATMDTTGRSVNAGGTINASGADYAEYMELIPHLWGVVPKGAMLGLDADGLLTDRWADVVGCVLVKSTAPNLVGGDSWGSDEMLCAKYGVLPVGEEPCPDAERPDAYAAELAAWNERRKQMSEAAEIERQRWDRMAICGQVPVNVPATSADVGKYLVPVEGDGGSIAGALVSRGYLRDNPADALDVVGRVVRIGEDGRAVLLVK